MRPRVNLRPRQDATAGGARRSRGSVGERPLHTRKVAGSIPAGTTTLDLHRLPGSRSLSPMSTRRIVAIGTSRICRLADARLLGGRYPMCLTGGHFPVVEPHKNSDADSDAEDDPDPPDETDALSGPRHRDSGPVRVGRLVANGCDQPSTPAWISARLASPHRHAVDHGVDRLQIRDVGDAQLLAAVFADQHRAEAVRANPKL